MATSQIKSLFMPNDYNLSLQDVIKTLGKAERTVQRYLRDGKLSKQYITTDRGREIRFSESEVKQLADSLAGDGGTGRRHLDDSGGGVMAGLDLKDFFNRYESAVAQVGYFKGRLEAHENEMKMLSGRVDSLAGEKSKLESEQKKLNQEAAQAELKMKELVESLEQEKEATAQKEKEYRARLRRLRAIYLIMVFGLLLSTLALSRLGQDIFGVLLGR
jgi:predicted DNA-binding transcriptional regulator AlpA